MHKNVGAMAPRDPHFLPDGTLTATHLAAHDWAASALGAPATWPPPLRSAVSAMLDSPVPAWLAWGDALTLIYNEAYIALLGGKHPRALGAPLRQVWAEVWPDVDALVATTLGGRSIYREDLPLVVDRDGTDAQAWFTFAYVPVRDGSGAVHGLACTVWETTGKVRAQQALEEANRALERRVAEVELREAQRRETEERYRLAVLATNDAVWDWRLADGHVVWNRALGALFGHAEADTDAGWWLEHIHPEDRGRIERGIHAVIDGGGTGWSDGYRFRRADGSYAEVFDRGTVLRDEAGQPLRMIGAMLDLSERQRAEAALRESERQFRTLFEIIDEGFCVIEFLDGPHGPLSDYVHVAANPAYTANAGIPDVVGQRVRDMVPQEADGWVEIYRRVLLTGEPVRFERELVRTGRYLELAAFRIEPPERRQVAVLFQDVTQR
ncbi:MAG: PAS domain S-box protein, partial [Rhodocyclaceae bacterium]|nr:PAS domain S-box protein [Rhodocyclaceae bacterium]